MSWAPLWVDVSIIVSFIAFLATTLLDSIVVGKFVVADPYLRRRQLLQLSPAMKWELSCSQAGSFVCCLLWATPYMGSVPCRYSCVDRFSLHGLATRSWSKGHPVFRIWKQLGLYRPLDWPPDLLYAVVCSKGFQPITGENELGQIIMPYSRPPKLYPNLFQYPFLLLSRWDQREVPRLWSRMAYGWK